MLDPSSMRWQANKESTESLPAFASVHGGSTWRDLSKCKSGEVNRGGSWALLEDFFGSSVGEAGSKERDCARCEVSTMSKLGGRVIFICSCALARFA